MNINDLTEQAYIFLYYKDFDKLKKLKELNKKNKRFNNIESIAIKTIEYQPDLANKIVKNFNVKELVKLGL